MATATKSDLEVTCCECGCLMVLSEYHQFIDKHWYCPNCGSDTADAFMDNISNSWLRAFEELPLLEK